MPVYERGMAALEDAHKTLEQQFVELQQKKIYLLQQHRSNSAKTESNFDSPLLEWTFVDRPDQPEPRYTVQV